MRCIKCGNFASSKVEMHDDYRFKMRYYCTPCLKISKKGELSKWQIKISLLDQST
jgi:hypothetical protein